MVKHDAHRIRLAHLGGGQSAHYLLEVIIASIIFSLLFLALTTVWMQHSRAMSALGSRLVAQHLAQEVMEECVAAGPEKVLALTSPRPPIVATETNRGTSVDIEYRVGVGVSPTGLGTFDPATHCKIVTVTIFYHDALGDNRIDFRTLLAVPP